jgi:predicted PurR-regulated permease PerM
MIRVRQPAFINLTINLLLFALVIGFLIVARELLIPLIVAIFFAFLLLPVSKQLERWKISRPVAIIISLILAGLILGGLVYFFYLQVQSFTGDIPNIESKVMDKLKVVSDFLLVHFNISYTADDLIQALKTREVGTSGGKLVLGIFSATGLLIANIALVPIYIFFMTLFRGKFLVFIKMTFSEDRHQKVFEIIYLTTKVSRKYLKGLLLDIMILSVLNSAGFLLLGIPHAILFGVLAAILNAIPYIGVLVGSILPVLMALLTKDEISYAIGALGVCVVVQFIDNNFITPMVVGGSVSINPLTAIIVLVASSLIWGVPGMVLCMPVTGVIKVICDHVKELKPYGYLIGSETDYEGARFFKRQLLKRNHQHKNHHQQ